MSNGDPYGNLDPRLQELIAREDERRTCSCGEAWADEPGHDDELIATAELNVPYTAFDAGFGGQDITYERSPDEWPVCHGPHPHPGPVDVEFFDRTAPDFNCVYYPGKGMHYWRTDQDACHWCGKTREETS